MSAVAATSRPGITPPRPGPAPLAPSQSVGPGEIPRVYPPAIVIPQLVFRKAGK